MKCQAFVPKVAKNYLSELLDGPSKNGEGLLATLKLYDSLIKREQESRKKPKIAASIAAIQTDMALTTPSFAVMRDGLATQIAAIHRLGEDTRMSDAYALLTTELQDGTQWRRFLRTAWGIAPDYQTHRNEIREARELAQQIVRRQRIWHQSDRFLRETFLPAASPV